MKPHKLLSRVVLTRNIPSSDGLTGNGLALGNTSCSLLKDTECSIIDRMYFPSTKSYRYLLMCKLCGILWFSWAHDYEIAPFSLHKPDPIETELDRIISAWTR